MISDHTSSQENFFQVFKEPIAAIPLPKRFTFPFYYEPHPLCLLAAKELQEHLQNQNVWEHNFGLVKSKKGLVIGKMFGVLIVQNKQGEIGYLVAFSGKLAEKNTHAKFVPPVFDMLTEGGFFLNQETTLNAINKQLSTLENNSAFIELQKFLKEEYLLYNKDISEKKEALKTAKAARKARREKEYKLLSADAYATLIESLGKESLEGKYFFNNVTRYWTYRLNATKEKIAVFTEKIKLLKEERSAKSAALQQLLFDQYQFLNQQGSLKGLSEIFKETALQKPPAGAGECAAPKLLQYAFKQQLKPLAMAEFWWGESPNTEIRKHQQFYPACQGKCKPILGHMLAGITMDTNPMLTNPAIGKELTIIYEDEALAVIHKPAEFLSVPGKNIQDSVFLRMKQRYPKATGPLIVHRLDMSTSGIMLIAKTISANKILQRQFIERTVKKRYVALLDGLLKENEGSINLPLRVDINDRPRQLVCHEHGKPAETTWKVIERKNSQTKVHFFPLTGRTHQLRVHASHLLGLNTPIVGDDLYGKKATRLYLHAELIEFTHPTSNKTMSFQIAAEF
ncbi:MAG: RluA family pseudouridine synthase [Polaribacter sp.]|nr:RluA family pseudouridine synthase [Polaribacter sp.]